jgi:glutamyl-Q tRNA(Asp) synthetase
MSHSYIGRFAPSPTGPLHIGSLIAALASYLQARQQQGKWLVRMEDLDPPREVPGAARSILDSLQAHGLHWDEPVLYQSQRQPAYQQRLNQLFKQGQAFYCNCTRADIQALGGIYQGHCRHQLTPPTNVSAIRVCTDDQRIEFQDQLQGAISQNLQSEVGDFVVRRKDGLFAYQLAVVTDDAEQGITDIVRGSDLLDSTPRQIHLQRLLNIRTPNYLHIPVITNRKGQKLSKQTFAKPLANEKATDNLRQALRFLNQPELPQQQQTTSELLQQALKLWDIGKVPKCLSIEQSSQQDPQHD